jgi:hypothetical protein
VIGLTLLAGCAFSYDKFYYSDGTKCAEVRAWVIGTGEIGKYIVDEWCGVTVMHDTKNTGFSDNATELGGKIAEGLAEGAVNGINPIP